MTVYYGNNDWRDFLSHSGRKGQKWGVQNGPPYPLGYSQMSSAELKAAKYRSKEMGRLDNRHASDTITINKRLDKITAKKRVTRHYSQKYKKLEKKEKSLNLQKKYGERLYKAERNAVAKMSIADIKEEKAYINKQRVKDFLFTVTLTGPVLGSIYTTQKSGAASLARLGIMTTDSAAYKSNRRIGADIEKALEDYHKNT